MKIEKVVLQDFGVYAGTNTFDFVSEKPIVLIGGMNGRGKTTLLEGILLALYGRRSFAFLESGMAFPKYLKGYINVNSPSQRATVALDFTLQTGEKKRVYRVERTWSGRNAVINLTTKVDEDGVYSKVLSENWDVFIERTLPSAIAPFFFFDGEKIAQLADSDTDVQMKNSIKSLLGLDIIDRAIADIQKAIMIEEKHVKFGADHKLLAQYQRQEEERSKTVDALEKELVRRCKERARLEKEIIRAQNKYDALGGHLEVSRGELLKRKEDLGAELNQLDDSLLDLAAADLPLLMTLPLLRQVEHAASQEFERQGLRSAVVKLPELYLSFVGEKTDFDFKGFLSFITDTITEGGPEYDLSRDGYSRLLGLCERLPSRTRESGKHWISARRQLLEKITEVENYLAIDVDGGAIAKQAAALQKKRHELGKVQGKIEVLEGQLMETTANLQEIRKERQKIVDRVLIQSESSDEAARVLKYARYSTDVLEKYKIRLQEAKTQQLADTMTECFRHLVAKKDLIDQIEIEPQTLKFSYFNREHREIEKSTLSAGEKQLLVIAMLWALGKCSKKELPVIIDTPMARLDSVHRETLLTNYFPYASEQTILLSTDSEVQGKYYDLLKPYIGCEFTLSFHDIENRTTVSVGYFRGDAE